MKNKEPEKRVFYMKDKLEQGICPICNKIVAIIISEKKKEIFGVCGECGGMIFYAEKSNVNNTLNINDRMD